METLPVVIIGIAATVSVYAVWFYRKLIGLKVWPLVGSLPSIWQTCKTLLLLFFRFKQQSLTRKEAVSYLFSKQNFLSFFLLYTSSNTSFDIKLTNNNNKQNMSETFRVCFCCSRQFKLQAADPPQEIIQLFGDYSKNDVMSAQDLLSFLNNVQGEKEADTDYVQEIFHRVKHHAVFHHNGLNFSTFYRYLLSDRNSALPLSPKVHHNMNAPLSHYFIYTGHNSYLTGNQWRSRSSPEPIVKALRRGVRVIELDLWPNRAGNKIEVCHGRTLTPSVDLHKCLNAIKHNAFYASEYPVVITFEDHLPPNLQEKVAVMVSRTFRGMLFRCESENLSHFPSPESLKNKILISTKPPKEYLEGRKEDQGFAREQRTGADKELYRSVKAKEEHIPEEDEDNVAPEYRNLIAIHSGKFKSGSRNWASDEAGGAKRISMSEQELETVVKSQGTHIVRFTQQNLLRIYPKSTRWDSSNYDPFLGWTHGAQMVAFNTQGYGKHLWYMHGMFMANGRCGYVKKPDVLLSVDPNHEVFNPTQKLPIKTTLKVKIFLGQGWNLDFSRTHFDQYSPPDFFVKIGIAGVPHDAAMSRTRTIFDKWMPVWNQEFEFGLSIPELALLWIKVKDFDSSRKHDFAGQTCLPVSELKTGFRAVRLSDRAGDVYKNVRLLVRFELDPPYKFQIS